MSANLFVGSADLDDLRDQVVDGEVDVLSVVELTPESAREIRRSEIGAALPHRVVDPRDGASGTGIFSRFPLKQLPAPGEDGFDLPTIIARATLPDGTTADVYSIHPPPPTNSANTATIRRYLEAIPSAAAEGAPRLLVGDFNATLDNDSLRDLLDRGYVDAADAEGAGLTPTWRQSIHPPVTLDHVIVDERVDVLDFDAEPLEGSDHRTVSAALRVPAPG
jgi:endonuclease/exonuclease/phosphatase family metal-dependent hydrolase